MYPPPSPLYDFAASSVSIVRQFGVVIEPRFSQFPKTGKGGTVLQGNYIKIADVVPLTEFEH